MWFVLRFKHILRAKESKELPPNGIVLTSKGNLFQSPNKKDNSCYIIKTFQLSDVLPTTLPSLTQQPHNPTTSPVSSLPPPTSPISSPPLSPAMSPITTPVSSPRPPMSPIISTPLSPALSSITTAVSSTRPPMSPIISTPLSPAMSPITTHASSPFPSNTMTHGFDLEAEVPATDSILNHDNLPPLLSLVLPPQHSYIFQSTSITNSNKTNSIVFSSIFLTNAHSTMGATQWLQEFFERTKTTYRVTRGTKTSGK